MDYNNLNTNSRKQKHLNAEERFYIEKRRSLGDSIMAIASTLHRSRTTIHAEIKRGSIQQQVNGKWISVYSASAGQQRYEKSRQGSIRRFQFAKCESFLAYCEEKFFKDGWSIDAAVGYALANGIFHRNEMLCSKTLYNYIHNGILKIKPIDLPIALKRKTHSIQTRKHKKQLGRSIDERSDEINSRKVFGHWEIDTVRGTKDQSDDVIVSLIERKTRFYVVLRCPSGKAVDVRATLEAWFQGLAECIDITNVCKSITADNGSEFYELPALENSDLKVYYAHPYSSWERGSNERHNGLFRRFVPKGTAIKDVSNETLKRAMEWSNNLPRKILGYKTPQEAFLSEVSDFLNLSPSVQFHIAI